MKTLFIILIIIGIVGLLNSLYECSKFKQSPKIIGYKEEPIIDKYGDIIGGINRPILED